MARRAAILYLGIASPMVLICFFIPGSGSETLFAILAMGYPVALIAAAVARKGNLGPLARPLALLLVLLESSLAGMLLLRGRVFDGPWLGGLPAAAAIQLYGLWLAPLLVVGLVYALSFDSYELRAEDIDRLERRFRNGGA